MTDLVRPRAHVSNPICMPAISAGAHHETAEAACSETPLCSQVWRDVTVKGFWLNVVRLCPSLIPAFPGHPIAGRPLEGANVWSAMAQGVCSGWTVCRLERGKRSSRRPWVSCAAHSALVLLQPRCHAPSFQTLAFLLLPGQPWLQQVVAWCRSDGGESAGSPSSKCALRLTHHALEHRLCTAGVILLLDSVSR